MFCCRDLILTKSAKWKWGWNDDVGVNDPIEQGDHVLTDLFPFALGEAAVCPARVSWGWWLISLSLIELMMAWVIDTVGSIRFNARLIYKSWIWSRFSAFVCLSVCPHISFMMQSHTCIGKKDSDGVLWKNLILIILKHYLIFRFVYPVFHLSIQTFNALKHGSSATLQTLHLDRNPFSLKRSRDPNVQPAFMHFFQRTSALKKLSLSECKLPPEALK